MFESREHSFSSSYKMQICLHKIILLRTFFPLHWMPHSIRINAFVHIYMYMYNIEKRRWWRCYQKFLTECKCSNNMLMYVLHWTSYSKAFKCLFSAFDGVSQWREQQHLICQFVIFKAALKTFLSIYSINFQKCSFYDHFMHINSCCSC